MFSVHQGVVGEHMPPNNVLIEFPADAPMDVAILAEVQALMRDVVRLWRPETAFYLNGNFRDAVMGVDGDGEGGVEEYVGWITYVDRYKDVKGLDVFSIEREGDGAFIQLVETPGQDFNAEVRRAIKARDKLVAAGVLKRR